MGALNEGISLTLGSEDNTFLLSTGEAESQCREKNKLETQII